METTYKKKKCIYTYKYTQVVPETGANDLVFQIKIEVLFQIMMKIISKL